MICLFKFIIFNLNTRLFIYLFLLFEHVLNRITLLQIPKMNPTSNTTFQLGPVWFLENLVEKKIDGKKM